MAIVAGEPVSQGLDMSQFIEISHQGIIGSHVEKPAFHQPDHISSAIKSTLLWRTPNFARFLSESGTVMSRHMLMPLGSSSSRPGAQWPGWPLDRGIFFHSVADDFDTWSEISLLETDAMSETYQYWPANTNIWGNACVCVCAVVFGGDLFVHKVTTMTTWGGQIFMRRGTGYSQDMVEVCIGQKILSEKSSGL